MKALIAMSGGVDSSAALLLSIEKYGRENICGVTLKLAEAGTDGASADEKNCADAKAVCDVLGVPHTSVDAYPVFRKCVIDYFTKVYFRGDTPNPCVVCNRDVKLGLLYEYAKANGFDKIVTGHYARTEERYGTVYLRRAADERKDQSYVLAMLSQEQLRAADFPLGGMTKPEVRELAAARGFASASRSDSQDICFIPDGDYAGFLKRYCGITDQPGEYVDGAGKVLGTHKGQWQYTIGQRKGLGISMGRHVFVLAKDAARNRVTLGEEEDLFRTVVRMGDVNCISGTAAVENGKRYTAKLRYAHRPAEAMVEWDGKDAVLVFTEPQRAPTAGQYAVVYNGDTVICAGVIR